jgi:hypothetical protein
MKMQKIALSPGKLADIGIVQKSPGLSNKSDMLDVDIPKWVMNRTGLFWKGRPYLNGNGLKNPPEKTGKVYGKGFSKTSGLGKQP